MALSITRELLLLFFVFDFFFIFKANGIAVSVSVLLLLLLLAVEVGGCCFRCSRPSPLPSAALDFRCQLLSLIFIGDSRACSPVWERIIFFFFLIFSVFFSLLVVVVGCRLSYMPFIA